jgi:CheY-like chemotaxis protein
MVIRQMLTKLGAQCVVVDNGIAAVQQFEETGNHFDLVLMDCEMPEMDGYEATRTIRDWEQRNHSQRTPIIALTAHAMREHVAECLQVGMDECLSKPVELTTLKNVISHFRLR